ncbi:MAG: FKBP-type peptidyl-prolyl cis-trans isomerase [Bacteroidales bacterium]|nr:FKBP-type peptidyl-prolyl cis-trans isomerase [Bacteroidales bacterium]MDD4685221.1 FKBP-type peptidyl-prolyl cis-trans isomerase [Bacteroidales bacterium]
MKRTILLVVCSIIATTLFSQNPLEGFKTSEQKVNYKFIKMNPEGQKVLENDLLIGKFTIKFGDSLVSDGTKMQSQPIVRTDSSSRVFQGDLIDGVLMMRKGEVCTFAFARDSIFKLFDGNLPPYFVSGMYAYWTMEIDDIKTYQEQKEEEAKYRMEQEAQMAEHKILSDSLVAEHKILSDSLAQLEPQIIAKAIKDYGFDSKAINGVYFKKTLTNKTNLKPKEGDKAKVHYIGKFTDGKLFDTSVEEAAKAANVFQQGRPYEPLEFIIGKRKMIPGFEEAVKMMNKGEKAIVLIPSNLAYGPDGRGEILPSSPLIFELELVEIEKGEAPKGNIQPIKMNTAPKKK